MVEFHTHTVGSYEAKTHLPALLKRVENGEEITITRHGAPVARIIPARKKRRTPEENAAAIDRWLESSKGLSLGGLKAKDLITEGRK